jgi:phage terminase large subunit-like protein
VKSVRAAISARRLFDYALSLSGYQPPLSPPEWIEQHFIDPISKSPLRLLPHQARILREALATRPDGSNVYNLVVWSQPKKSGKTTIAAAVGAFVAWNIEPPNDICTVANDQEQAAGRIFAAMLPTLEALGAKVPTGLNSRPAALLPNGTTVRAITSRYEGEAGANQGLSLWSELWAYSSERLQRLWDELTPPPTRRFRMRWVETYAGFKGEGRLLWQLYTLVFRDDDERELQPGVRRLWEDLPVYVVEPIGALVYWDHQPRMPWQTPEYYESQRQLLRPSAFLRLHENRWVDEVEEFITLAMWRAACRLPGPPTGPAAYGSVFALDGAKNDDCYALVGVKRVQDEVHLVHSRIWSWGVEVDQSEVESEVLRLYHEGVLGVLYYDPYQLVGMAQRLRAQGVPCVEFSQLGERIKSDTFLSRLFSEGSIAVWDDPVLRQHVCAARVRQLDGQRVRIIKPDVGDQDQRKVDGAVALSMAAYRAWSSPEGGWAW